MCKCCVVLALAGVMFFAVLAYVAAQHHNPYTFFCDIFLLLTMYEWIVYERDQDKK